MQRSTKETDRAAAEQIAFTYEKAARAARNRTFTDATARKFLSELSVLTGTTVTAIITTEDWFKRWLRAITPSVKAKTAQRYRSMVVGFLRFLGPARAAPLADVTPVQIKAWRDSLVLTGTMSEITANLTLSNLSQSFREARTLKVIDANPCEGLRFRHAEARRQRRDAFTLAQFRALLAACADDPALAEWRTFLLVLGLTGCRQQEAAQLHWSQIDFEQSRITLTRGKDHDRAHIVPMDAWLTGELRATFARARGLLVTPTIAALDGRQVSNTFRRRILPRIGVAQPYGAHRRATRSTNPNTAAAPRGPLVLAKLQLHSLRHSMSTWLDQTGATPATRRAMLGHRTAAINETYTHAELDHTRAALARVTAELSKTAS